MLKPANAVIFFLWVLLYCSFGCKSGSVHPSAKKKYSLYILGRDGKEFILETDRINSGTIYPEKEGAQLDVKDIDRDIIVRNGFYYHLNRKKELFSKYQAEGSAFKNISSVTVKDFSIENYRWLGGDTLLLTGLDWKKFSQVKYVLLKTGKMEIISSGNIDIPGPSGRFTSMSIGFVEIRKHRLFMGYTYHQQLSGSDYTTSDTTYVSELSYPELKMLKTEKDTRSTYPGGINTVQSYSFNDEHHNYYFMTCPGIALGNRPDRPTGIYRIKAGEDFLDQDYFFNLSGSVTRNHAYGMWYLGNHQAIIRSERKDLFKGLSDHYSTAHFEFYLIDLDGKVLKKLDLPLDKGTRRECVIVENGIAYIAVNSTKEGNYIWMYHIKSGALVKGARLAGDTDFIMRIDKLY